MQLSEGLAQQLVDQLDHSQDVTSEVRILRSVKNDVTGHELRKIAYIRAGLVPTLADVLSLRSNTELDRSQPQPLSAEDEAVWWQATSIIVVLANAGSAFTYTLLDTNLLPLLTARLRTSEAAERVTLNILRCLNAFAENLPLDIGDRWNVDQSLAKCLYTPENAVCLARLSAIPPDTSHSQQCLEAVLNLICNTCRSDSHVSALNEAGLLDILCAQLAAQISDRQLYVREDVKASYTNTFVHQASHLTLILQSLTLAIQHSRSRTQEFVTNTAIERALVMAMGTSDTLQRLAPCGVLPDSFVLDEQHVDYDFPLPQIPDLHAMYLAKNSTWPPLSASTEELMAAMASRRQASKPAENAKAAPQDSWIELDKDKTQNAAIVPWLLHVARSGTRGVRVMAARLLVVLKSHDLLNGKTMRSLATLLVPVLVDMLEKIPEGAVSGTLYTEQVPFILALLVKDHEFLQQAAVEAKAIPRLAMALKANFDSVNDLSSELWWPNKLEEKLTAGHRDRSLGPGGPSRAARLQMQMREGILQALAALAPDSDVFRKDICDQGALNHIILALEPFHSHTITGEHYDKIAISGNSSETLVAACGAVRALTRSPTSLRTKIVDADVTKHIVNLLYTAEVSVRIAATKVISNLSHGFSPMRTLLGEPSVIKKLCEQAHSAHAELRYETLFALKALINLSSNKMKRMVLEELGVNWIRHVLATDPHDIPTGEVIGLFDKDNRKGSTIRVSEDADMYDAEPTVSEEDIGRYNRHTLEQDLEILAELLGFVRNLTTGEQPSEIIDFVLEEIGRDEFLQIIVDRLKAGTTSHPHISEKIIQNCLYIITHLAIADAKYRSPIAHNLILMKQVNALLNHADHLVRRACCWLIISVIYSTDETYSAAVSRAKDLQRLGIVANLRRMEKNDLSADVKERASTACGIFEKLLDKS